MKIDTKLQADYTKITRVPLTDNPGSALDIIRHHHEKLDGSGYPDGLKGDEIVTVVRIMAVVDIYDALVTDRPFRKGLAKERAFQALRNKGPTESLIRILSSS